MQINPAWVEMVDEMNQRLIYVLKDAVECRCRPNIDDIDAQNILFSIEEIAHLRAKVAELEAKLEKYENLEPVAWRCFDGEGGYDYFSYVDNENYRDEFLKRNTNPIYKSWVEPLYALEK